jgi:hypothetical protein
LLLGVREAVESLEAAAKLAPGQAHIHYQLGRAYIAAGRQAEGEGQLEIARQLKDKALRQLLVSNNCDAPLLLRNEGGNNNNWLGLQLVATKSNPAAAGAVISWQAGGVRRTRLKTAGGSYRASHDPREVLGLGAATKVEAVEIRWPSGMVDKLSNLPAGAYLKVIEGQGVVRK